MFSPHSHGLKNLRKISDVIVSLPAHLHAAANIIDLFERGEVLFSELGSKGEAKTSHKVFAPFVFDGKTLVAKVTVQEYSGDTGNRIYSVEAMKVLEPVAGTPADQASSDHDGQPNNPLPASTRRKLREMAESVNPEKFLNVLDENGEPVVSNGSFDAQNPDIRFSRPFEGEEFEAELVAVEALHTNADGTRKATWLKAPNGNPTKLTQRQWLQVRTPSFKAWFGDWLRASLRKFLDGTPLMELQSSIAPEGNFKNLTEWATDLFQQQGGVAHNPEIGDVRLDGRSVRDSIAHGGANKFKRAAFASVKDVIERGRVIGSNFEKNRRSHFIAAPVRIDGMDDIVLVVVHETPGARRMYLHAVGKKESLLANRVSSAPEAGTGSSSSGDPLTMLRDIFAVNPDAVSQALDENGEPEVLETLTLDSPQIGAGQFEQALNAKGAMRGVALTNYPSPPDAALLSAHGKLPAVRDGGFKRGIYRMKNSGRHVLIYSSATAQDAIRSLQKLRITPERELYYTRGTKNPDEPSIIKGFRSKNHHDDYYEDGMSVSTGAGYSGLYPYSYQVMGDVVGRGSDGEAVLANVIVLTQPTETLNAVVSADNSRREAANPGSLFRDFGPGHVDPFDSSVDFEKEGPPELVLPLDYPIRVSARSVFVSFPRSQIKSATDNSGSFDAQNPDIRFSRPVGRRSRAPRDLPPDDRYLAVLHNLSASKLFSAARLGGLAVPSLAITDVRNPHTGFGDITLLGDSSLADPQQPGNKVFSADVYSPTFPRVERDMSRGDFARLRKHIKSLALGRSSEFPPKDVVLNPPSATWLFQEWDVLSAAYIRDVDPDDGEFSEDDFRDWLDTTIEEYNPSYYIEHKSKRLPLTVENLLLVMTSKSRNAIEETKNGVGFGNIQAAAAKQYSSLSEVKAERKRVVSFEDATKSENALKRELESITDFFVDAEWGLDADPVDVYKALIKHAEGKRNAFSEFRSISEDKKLRVNDFLSELRALPVITLRTSPNAWSG